MAAVTLVRGSFCTKLWWRTACPSSMCLQSRDHSTTNLTDYKRGRGGRSSFSGIIATVFGASGQLGQCVVARLGRIGSQIIVPYRSDSYNNHKLKTCGDLGQVLFQEYHLRDEASIRHAMKYSNVVINVIGRNWETKNFKYPDIYDDGPRRLARIAREMGISKFIHVSHINASHEPQKIYVRGGSRVLRAKKAGEEAVLEEFPNAVIVRPSDMFGPQDKFMHYWCMEQRRTLDNMPIWNKGKKTIKQPVFTFDVAEAIMKLITNPEYDGKIIQAVGPHRYTLHDLVAYFFEIMNWPHHPIVHMHPIMWMKVIMQAYQPQQARINLEIIEKESVTDHVDRHLPTLEDLGMTLKRVEDRAKYECNIYRRDIYYDDYLGEFPDAKPPPIVSPRPYFE